MQIQINVVGKIATAVGNPYLVCGNSNDTILFTFDSEWKSYSAKTARFIYEIDGEEKYTEVAFGGTTCKVPVLTGIKKVDIGVYAGGLATTRCKINCKTSILDGEGSDEGAAHGEPGEDIYNQIMELCNEAATAGNEATAAAAGFEATTRTTFGNALKGNLYGAAVRADDVSPVEHALSVKVRSKNLVPYPYTETTLTRGGLAFTSLGDGTVSVKGTVTDDFATFSMVDHIELFDGVTYFVGNSPHLYIAYKDPTQTMRYVYNAPFKWSKNYTFFKLFLQYTKGEVVDEVIKPMLSVGDTATEYTPYIDPSTATITRCGKNVFATNEATVAAASQWATANIGKVKIAPGNYVASCYFNQVGTDKSQVQLSARSYKDYLVILDSAFSDETTGKLVLPFTVSEEDEGFQIYLYSNATANALSTECVFTNIMVEAGDTATNFEEYKGGETYTPNADGTVEGITSLSPSMTLLTDTANTVINCEYNRDINAVIADIYSKITE